MFSLALALVFAVAPGDPKADVRPAQGEVEISGVYVVSGSVGAEKYRGLAVIQKVGSAYAIVQVMNGQPVQMIGVRSGSSLAISWVHKLPDGQTTVGSALHTITAKDGSPEISGVWVSTPDVGRKSHERFTFLCKLLEEKE